MDRCCVTGHATSLLEGNWFVKCLVYDVTGQPENSAERSTLPPTVAESDIFQSFNGFPSHA